MEIEWLVNELIYFGDEEVFKEVVRNVVNIIYFLVNSIVNELIILRVDNLIDIVWFSDLMKLFCVIVFVVKFVNNLKNIVWIKLNFGSGIEIFIVLELINVEEFWIKVV